MCPGCGCFKQQCAESNLGIPLVNTFKCNTCECLHQIQRDGEVVILKEGKHVDDNVTYHLPEVYEK